MNWFENKKLLVPWDYSELSNEALKAAREMADSANHVTVVHVAPALSAAEPGVVWGAVDNATRTASLKEHFVEQAGELANGIAFEVAFGDPGFKIIETSERLGSDCIVISTNGRGGIEHLLVGSVAERVARLATCPVVLLPGRKR